MPPEFEIIEALRRHRVRFVVVGGHAVNFHGYRRATEVVDVVWARADDSEAAFVAALSEIGACSIGKEIDPATGLERTHPITSHFVRANHLMMLWTRHGFLDLFDYIPGFPSTDVAELFRTSVETDDVRFASLQWLRQMKEVSGRPRDRLDLENLPPSP